MVGARDPSKPQRFAAYGTPSPDIPDPTSRAIDGLLDHIDSLATRVKELESELDRLARSAPDSFEGEQEGAHKKPPPS